MFSIRKNKFYSLRSRLTFMAMGVVLLPMLLATVFSVFSYREQINRSLTRELQASLGACKLYYQNIEERLALTTMATANDNTCKTTLRLGVLPQLQKQLETLAREYKMDFLLATDTSGRIVAMYPSITDSAADISQHPLVRRALEGKTVTITIQEDHPLLARAAVGGPDNWQQQTELLIESAVPIKNRDAQIGTLLAAVRLSDNTPMMQAMQKAAGTDHTALVTKDKFFAASYPFEIHLTQLPKVIAELKTANSVKSLTILRCSMDGERKVFDLFDIAGQDGKPAATLVTILDYERAWILIKDAVLQIIVIFLAAILLAAIITFFVARSISSPLNALSLAMQDMENGTLGQTALPVNRNDEIGKLVRGFNAMVKRIQTFTHSLETEVTVRLNAQKELADEKERLAVTLHSIGDAVITTDTAGKVVFINNAAEELTGWTNGEAQGQAAATIFSLIDEKTGATIASPVHTVLETGRPTTLANDTALVAKNGVIRSIADSGAPILDWDSNMLGVVIVFRDITHEKRIESELFKVMKLESVGVLAGGIAHDFNNILAAILGNIEVAAFRIAGKDEGASALLAEAQKAIMRASYLTKQLLTFSKGGNPVKDSASLPAVIQDSADFVLHGSKVGCEYHFPKYLWKAEVDIGQISQVIQNIILNAKHAMPEGGKIIISGDNITDPASEPLLKSQEGCYVRITIRDSGSGIPPEIIDRIFDPYFTTKETGNGLGLAICHSIIRKHNGHLLVQSEPDQGTTFSIYLPVHSMQINSSGTRQAGLESPARPIKSARVMILDDEMIIREVIRHQLTALGHQAVLVENGAEAIRMYETLQAAGTPVDLVIMDLTIPGGMGGKEAASILLQKDPNARLIVSSGYSNDPVMANYQAYGFRAAISKPFELTELQAAIEEALRP
ncbi:MAG: PAS domain [Desulfobulbaceae bacterium]|jgi:PAS domain S-box-containing protein|nr:MAG: PAS domain [Desulfobulbaceae bacterium]